MSVIQSLLADLQRVQDARAQAAVVRQQAAALRRWGRLGVPSGDFNPIGLDYERMRLNPKWRDDLRPTNFLANWPTFQADQQRRDDPARRRSWTSVPALPMIERGFAPTQASVLPSYAPPTPEEYMGTPTPEAVGQAMQLGQS